MEVLHGDAVHDDTAAIQALHDQRHRKRMESHGIGQSNGFEGGFERLEGRAAEQAFELTGSEEPFHDAYSHMADGLLIARDYDDKWHQP